MAKNKEITPMHTVVRHVKPVSLKNKEILEEIFYAYFCEKKSWLSYFERKENRIFVYRPRELRDSLVAQKYTSPNNLQARMWKCAFFEAANTWKTFYDTITLSIRKTVYKNQNFQMEKNIMQCGYCKMRKRFLLSLMAKVQSYILFQFPIKVKFHHI